MMRGMIQKVAAGIYDYLPLARRSIRKFRTSCAKSSTRRCQDAHAHRAAADLWQESSR
jgi:prolyl-tRNA synthetase